MRNDFVLPIMAALGVVILAAAPGQALAQATTESRMGGLKLSGDQPIQIESDKLEVREQDNVAVFSGNVSVVQGPTLMKSGKMTVYYTQGGSGSAATGSAKSETFVLSGDEVVLSEGSNVLVGCKLIVHMKTGQAQVDGCKKSGSGGRVMMSITPESQNR